MVKVSAETKTEVAIIKTEMQMFKEANDKAHEDIKKDICDVKSSMDKIVDKLDTAIDRKADKAEVERIRKGIFWAVTALLGMLASIFLYIIEGHIKL